MAAPSVPTESLDVQQTNITDHVHDLPASIASGDGLVAQISSPDVAVTTPSGWTEFDSQVFSTYSRLRAAYREADGTEGSTFTWVFGAATRSACRVLRITGTTLFDTTPPEATGLDGGVNKNIDAPNHTPSGGSDDYLWIAGGANNRGDDATTYPYAAGNEAYGDASGVDLLSDWKTATAASEDPSAFIVPTNARWCAHTISVAPVAAGGDLNISATSVTLDIAAQNATVNLTREIAAVLVALNIAAQNGAVNLTREILATLATLDIASQVSDINLTREIAATLVALNIASQNAVVVKGINLTPDVMALTIAAQNANVNASREIAATLKTLNIAPQDATVERVRNIQATLATLTIQSYKATVDLTAAVTMVFRRIGIRFFSHFR